MTETLDELKAIFDNAPEGATHYDGIYYMVLDGELQSAPSKRFGWEYVYDVFEIGLTRSLSDIKARIELMEWKREMLLIISDSTGVAGYHMNGEVAEWSEFDL